MSIITSMLRPHSVLGLKFKRGQLSKRRVYAVCFGYFDILVSSACISCCADNLIARHCVRRLSVVRLALRVSTFLSEV